MKSLNEKRELNAKIETKNNNNFDKKKNLIKRRKKKCLKEFLNLNDRFWNAKKWGLM